MLFALRVGEVVALKTSGFSETLVNILSMIMKVNEERNFHSEYLLLDKDGESGALSNEEIRTFAGHKDFSTTEKYYMHATTFIENRSEAYERDINSKISNVFKRVQNY